MTRAPQTVIRKLSVKKYPAVGDRVKHKTLRLTFRLYVTIWLPELKKAQHLQSR